MEKQIETSITDGIGHICLNNPKRRNCLSQVLIEQLIQQLSEWESDERVKMIVLSGKGKSFCSGGDIHAMQELESQADISAYMEAASRLPKVIMELDKMVVAAVHGHAAGAGFSLALAADFIVAEVSAVFSISFQQIGLIPDLGLMKLLTERISVPLAKQWILEGKAWTAREADDLGIINILTEDNAKEAAHYWAVQLASGPLSTHKYVKYMLNHVSAEMGDYLLKESEFQQALLQTKDHKEGVQAFLEKRNPVFSGQ
ncbi:enoyl-CoA hydratase/isomerase family protein [Sediminibacillus halophilus]|uniref:2-(1,2-epoxy-1,2-dihydrophenyl)acetyl-CoA isomerase n=1 Tax=Sediminibacillus halophilus TaxID=482461 RepID=A0A1G9M555_9BACI|nr:enoyl-CoA hydratase/isomerase family protein [Sediminibacillus halophilus]SDL69400.1 2-(1,2-epoxy-1,2-dihydrophenyl)acetyl-CoA isomerase [Sediminibacillus halophilus]